jgi:hypothetical protein
MPCASNQCVSASQIGPSASRTVARPFIFRQRGAAVYAVQITSDVHTPARCDALNSSHLAKDLKCCRQPSPLAVTDLCRACSALAFSEVKKGRLLFGHCIPAGSDPLPNGPLHGLVGWLSIEWRCVEDSHWSASSSHNPGYCITKPMSDTCKGAA